MIAASRVGRDGRLALGFERRGPRTIVTRCRYTLPLQVLAPIALDDAAAIVSVLNPTGGLVGGDALEIEVDVTTAAHACLTTPSATKVYRAAGAAATQDVTVRLAAGARLEWVPDHVIPHAGAAFRQRFLAEVDDDAALVVIDAFAAGRVARDEAWRFALLDSTLSVRDRSGPIVHDRFVLRDGGPSGLGITERRPYFATVIVVADAGVAAFAERVAAFAAGPDVEVGAGLLGRRGAVVRCLAADAPGLGRALEAVWAAARAEVLGLPWLALRKT
ncbi:MAG TPA: urease accessory protein UreD [Methylomirabilota bacterium]|nr:urease accessory protein UreD [Methylomirabilota bacterium]